MLKEALEWIGKNAEGVSTANLLSVPGDGRKVYVDQNGTLTPLDVTPACRGHKVDSVEDLIAAALRWNSKPVVWINGDAVVLLTDDDDRRDRVTLPLVKSHQFARLIQLAAKPELSQPDLIRLLRIDLPGAGARAVLLATVRNIKWRTAAAGNANIQHGNESMGKSIEAEVTGAGAIPEQVLVTGPVYRNHGERDQSFGVLCDLEIVPADQVFRFKPLPDEIERVTEAALEGIRERLFKELGDFAIFYGTP